MVFKACGIVVLIGLVAALSIPREYPTKVTLASESAGKTSVGGMGTLAAMVGTNLGGALAGEDALSPELYPDTVKSTSSLLELFDVKIRGQEGKVDTTLCAYLDEYQRLSWVGAAVSVPLRALG